MRTAFFTSLSLALVITVGCSPSAQNDASPSAEDALGHIHGLGVDPHDDALYVATHTGVHRVDGAGRRSLVGDRRHDTMAFTVVGPRHFLASGHPDPREDLPPHLGLIESSNAGKTWKSVALEGRADFHLLEPAGSRLYAYDALTGKLLTMQDRQRFQTVATTPLLSLVAMPDGETLLGTNAQARLVRIDAKSGTVEMLEGPRLVVLDATKVGDIVGLGPEGTVHLSGDGAETWTESGSIGGPPAALNTITDVWYAATAQDIFRSRDNGGTWSSVLKE